MCVSYSELNNIILWLLLLQTLKWIVDVVLGSMYWLTLLWCASKRAF